MHVALLFDSLLFAPHVEVVLAPLPKRFAAAVLQPARTTLLEHLQRRRERRSPRLAQAPPNAFPFLFKDGSCPGRAQFRLSAVTTEHDEMEHSAHFWYRTSLPGMGDEILPRGLALPALRAQNARRMRHPHQAEVMSLTPRPQKLGTGHPALSLSVPPAWRRVSWGGSSGREAG